VALVEIWGPVEVVIVTQPCNRYDALLGGVDQSDLTGRYIRKEASSYGMLGRKRFLNVRGVIAYTSVWGRVALSPFMGETTGLFCK
jgi:hypothetical protein